MAGYAVTGRFVIGVAKYLTWPETSWARRLTSTHHLWFIPFCIAATVREAACHASMLIVVVVSGPVAVQAPVPAYQSRLPRELAVLHLVSSSYRDSIDPADRRMLASSALGCVRQGRIPLLSYPLSVVYIGMLDTLCR